MRTQQLTNTINLLGIKDKVLLVHSSGNRTGHNIYMKPIDQKEEDKIDKRNNKDNIYLYGDVNLNDPKDIETIKSYNFFNTEQKGMIYTNFDYDRGLFTLVEQSLGNDITKTEHVVKWAACMDPVLWFKFNHCLIGKPDKIIIYTSEYEGWGR